MFAIDFDSAKRQRLEFGETEIAPLGHLVVVVQDGVTKEQILAVVFGDVPVAATDEKMQVDVFFLSGVFFAVYTVWVSWPSLSLSGMFHI